MKPLKSLPKVTSVAILTSCCLVAPAQANKVKHNSVSSPTSTTRIHVLSSNGEAWDRVDKNRTFDIQLPGSFSCNFGNHSKGEYYDLAFDFEGLTRAEGSLSPKPYDPKKQIKASFRYNQATATFDPLEVCQTELEKRLNANPNRTKYHILSKTFPVSVKGALKGQFTATCLPTGIGPMDTDNKSLALDVEVMCQGSPLAEKKIPKKAPEPVKPVEMSIVELVTDAKFYAKDPQQVGPCPMNVELAGWMKFSRPGTVRYRYVGSNGRTSPTLTLEAEKAGRLRVRNWNTSLKKPDVGSIRATETQDNSSQTLKGAYTLEFVDPPHLPSIRAEYSATCTQEMQLNLSETGDEERLRKRPGRAKFGDDTDG